MPNKNYESGRRFEYERMKYYRDVLNCHVMRTAGSHGFFDLIAIAKAGGHCYMIQCKVVTDAGDGKRLLQEFKKNPPFCTAAFKQVMEVKVKGQSGVMSWTL